MQWTDTFALSNVRLKILIVIISAIIIIITVATITIIVATTENNSLERMLDSSRNE